MTHRAKTIVTDVRPIPDGEPLSTDLALFQSLPALRTSLSVLPLASLPTPVDAHPELAEGIGAAGVYVKRDDRTHPEYGGNKIRKLCFLLAQARLSGAGTVITFGAAGSNHALATALCAREYDLATTLILGPQHNSRHVRANLLAYLSSGAELCPCAWKHTASTAARAFHRAWKRDGHAPFVIPPGGSSPLGALGYVNAAFELREQVKSGLLPEPDIVYVPSGTMGTCVGLCLGVMAAGLKTRIMAVRVTTPPYTSLEWAQRLFTAANAVLCRHDPAFPECNWHQAPMELCDHYFGKEYALFTPEGVQAVRVAREQLGLSLEGTYTGKAFAALLGHGAAGMLRGKQALFWNTYAGECAEHLGHRACVDRLPALLRQYFEEPTQALDV